MTATVFGAGETAETVFSHPSKLEPIATARAAGYTVVLHVLLIPEQLAVAGLAYRVQAGWLDAGVDELRSFFDAAPRCA
jgi:predicted ABC-type ATPase